MVAGQRKPDTGVADAGGASTTGAELFVTAQQSRFHVDATEDPNSKNVEIKDLSITIGKKEVLAHANIKLQDGVHYVLAGRNGVGKSTLLRALGEGRVPGIPSNLRILLLGQTSPGSSTVDQDVSDGGKRATESVLEHVVRSDKQRERLIRESQMLSKVLENPENQEEIVSVFRTLKHEQLERDLAVAKEIAARRSGTRGMKARKELKKVEEEVEASEIRLTKINEIDAGTLSQEVQEAVALHSELETSLGSTDVSSAESRAQAILLGLGFPPEKVNAPFRSLSGGWQVRCSLATLLFLSADVLLLDEPTNFLDLTAMLWLQNYLQDLPTTIVTVTHDRAFADAVGEELLLLRDLTLERFKGNLTAYETERAQQQRRLSRMKEAQEKQKAHISQTIAGNVAAAKRAGDDKKLKQAASRKKKLEERMGLQVGKTGGRFKLNRDRVGFHNTLRDEIEVPKDDAAVKIRLPGEAPKLRFPGALIALEGVSFAYMNGTRRGEPVLRDITLSIHPGERVGIAGVNGAGKSTLVSLIMASEAGRMKPTSGTITRHSQLQIKCFSQKAVEDLEALGREDGTLTALSIMVAEAAGELTEADARAILSSLGLRGKTVSDVPVTSLSGGQKVRLALAQLVWKLPHLLILDEVTTHLDTDTILALVQAFNKYEGALLVITHDRFFMKCAVEGQNPLQEVEDEDSEDDWQVARKGVVYRLAKGRLRALEGGMQRYEELAVKAATKLQIS